MKTLVLHYTYLVLLRSIYKDFYLIDKEGVQSMLVVQDYDVRLVDVDRRWYLDVETHLHESEDWLEFFGAVLHDGFAVCLRPLLLLLSDSIQPGGSGGIGTAIEFFTASRAE